MHGTFIVEWEDDNRDRFDLIQLPWGEFENRYIDSGLMQITGIPRYFAVNRENNSLVFWPFPEYVSRTPVRDTCR